MLDPVIIAEILKREEALRREQDRPQPQPELPVEHPEQPRVSPEESEQRGVVVIDI